jgi:hypothetical protein
MSKIAAISPWLINTHLSYTQPIWNLLGGVLVNLSSSAAYIISQWQILIGRGQCPISLLLRTDKLY